MERRAKSLTIFFAIATLTSPAGLIGCGSGSPPSKQTSSPIHTATANPAAVIARVEPYVITADALGKSLLAEAARESNSRDSLSIRACLASLVSESPSSSGTGHDGDECKRRYRVLRERALTQLISDYWLIGGADELGVDVSTRQAQESLTAQKSGAPDDQLVETRAKLASRAIQRALRERIDHLTAAQIASYYQAHRDRYLVPEERDLEIIRATSSARASRAKAEIASGTPVAKVVTRVGGFQTAYSHKGALVGLQPKIFRYEPRLEHAIFTAKRGTLIGPIKTIIGYFVFRVTSITPGYYKSLAEVTTSIRRTLPGELRRRSLASFVKRWRARWRLRTSCQPGYLVPKCREFRGLRVGPPEDPYALT